MKHITHPDPCIASALVALTICFAKYGTQWPMEYDSGHYDLWRAREAEDMLAGASYFEACQPWFNADLLAEKIAAAANASDSDACVDGRDDEAAIAISSAIVSLGQAMGIQFRG